MILETGYDISVSWGKNSPIGYSGHSGRDIDISMFTMRLGGTYATILCCDGPLSSKNSRSASISLAGDILWSDVVAVRRVAATNHQGRGQDWFYTVRGSGFGRLLRTLSQHRSLHRMSSAGEMLVFREFLELSGPSQHGIVAHVLPKRIVNINMSISRRETPEYPIGILFSQDDYISLHNQLVSRIIT